MGFRSILPLILLSNLLLISLFTFPASALSGLLIQKTWGGTSGDVGYGVAVDSFGNTYVTGYSYSFGPGNPSHGSLSLLKYNATGSLIWQRIWSGSGNGTDYGQGVAVDSSGNVFVAGYTNSFGAGGNDVLLLKFNSTDGSLLWQKTWGGSGDDTGYGVAIDASGSIFVTGETISFGAGSDDVLLLKFNSTDGSLLWQRTWGGSSNDLGHGVVVDSSGNVYVTGSTNSFGAGAADILLLKFNSTGSLLWQTTWGGSSDDGGRGVAIDASGNIYITGETYSFGAGAPTYDDVVFLKFDSSGGLLWQRTWGGGGDDVGTGVAVDSSKNIYVTGYTFSYGTGSDDVSLLKFNSTGSLLWQRTWGGIGSDAGLGIAVDSSGNALVAGGVSEAPPYTLGTPSFTLGTPAFTPGVPAFTLGTPTFTLGTPKGTVQTPLGSQSYAGAPDQFLIKYGPLPTVAVIFQTSPGVGSIRFNGTDYADGQSGTFTYGTVSISAHPPAGYVFRSWSSTGGVSVASPTANATAATIAGPGTLKVDFNSILQFVTSTGSGSITFNGRTYINGATGAYATGTFTVSATPPSGYKFAGWTTTGGVSVASNTENLTLATVTGPGILKASFTITSSTPLYPSAVLLAALIIVAALVLTGSTALLTRRRRSTHAYKLG
jgi:uncharacterized delta-60 repeat protein